MPPNDFVKPPSGVAALPGEVGTIVEHMLNGMAYCKMLFEDGQPSDFIYLYTNPAFESLTGLSDVVGRRVSEVIPGIRESDPQLLDVFGRVARGGAPEKFETWVEALGMWFAITVYRPKPEHFVAIFDVITERKQAEQNLLRANERLSLAQRTAGAGVWDWDIPSGTLIWSDELFQLFGLDPAATVATFDIWRSVVHSDDLQRAEEAITVSIRNHAPHFNEYRIVLPTGAVRWIDAFGDTTYDADGNALRMIGICIDTTARKLAEAQIEFLAHHDHLTRLPNRFVATERLKMAMAYADRANENVALLFLDLDSFKPINDSLGHAVGDLLLVEVARRLQACLRETDTVSRQGGDEFLVILTHIHDMDDVTGSAAKIVAALAAPCEIEGHVLEVTVSVGIAIYPNDAQDTDTLMQRADTAMYHAKGTGGNDYTFFSEQMNAAVAMSLAVRGELRQALAGGEFELHYQPQIDLASGRVTGVEALLRWHSPKRGLVLPDAFVSVAEDCGLIVPIGEWVLQEACRQAVRWQQAGLPELTVAVNLSAMQFRRGNLQQSVVQALSASGLAPARLELELTESLLIVEAEYALETVLNLRSLGIRFAIDDFGTGYSSLAYLKRFPIDKLKIAQTFVQDMNTNPEDAAIVHAIIQMARALNLRTIAEGIETEDTVEHLRLHHCDEAQGNYFSRPLLAEEFQQYVLAVTQP
ncbi:MAG: EAL domain-containing protein [Thiobacillus sp.]|nr:EAL domain-containing protein [Thiobacillus sp.]